MTQPFLVIFDVDGTLVDSQADILAAMSHAFGTAGLPAPSRSEVLSIVGLSLETAILRLVPGLEHEAAARMAGWYKDAYVELRRQAGAAESSPLYPGIRAVLDELAARDEILLGVATGKSQRGLDVLLQGHGLERTFVTRQVSDHHPSKPHPSMVQAALAETGTAAERAVMIGDTSYDMEMARAAGVTGIGVTWGYHAPEALDAAAVLARAVPELPGLIARYAGSAMEGAQG